MFSTVPSYFADLTVLALFQDFQIWCNRVNSLSTTYLYHWHCMLNSSMHAALLFLHIFSVIFSMFIHHWIIFGLLFLSFMEQNLLLSFVILDKQLFIILIHFLPMSLFFGLYGLNCSHIWKVRRLKNANSCPNICSCRRIALYSPYSLKTIWGMWPMLLKTVENPPLSA